MGQNAVNFANQVLVFRKNCLSLFSYQKNRASAIRRDWKKIFESLESTYLANLTITSQKAICHLVGYKCNFMLFCKRCMGHMVGQFFRHCATSRKVAVSILDGDIKIFLLLNFFGHTVALESMHNAANITIFMCRLSRSSRSLKLIEPYRLVQICNGIAVPFYCYLTTVSQIYVADFSVTIHFIFCSGCLAGYSVF